MLQRLGEHIANCLDRASDADRRAADATDEALRADNERMARSWRNLARNYQFVESLERFLLDAERKGLQPPDPPPSEIEGIRLPSAVFDPDIIALLTAVYNKAIEGQPAYVYEIVAKCIIDLAAEGERDPDKLCQVALAVLTRQPHSR